MKEENIQQENEKESEPHRVDEQLQPENEPSHPIALKEAALQLVQGLESKEKITNFNKFGYQTRELHQSSFKLPTAP